MNEKHLEKIGLGKNEIKVYLTLLELGESKVSEIAEKSGVYRRTIYDALKKLIEKGLVTYIVKGKKRYFNASNPKILLNLVKEQEENIKQILPELTTLKKKTQQTTKAEIYTGKEALRKLIEEQFESGEFLAIGMTSKAWELFPFSIEHMVKKLKRFKTKAKILAHEEAKETLEKTKQKLSIKDVEIRYLAKEYYVPSTILIWEDKVSISYHDKFPIIIVIENKEINKAYRNYFSLLWKQAKKK